MQKTPCCRNAEKSTGIAKGSAVPNRDKVGKITRVKQVKLQKKKCKILMQQILKLPLISFWEQHDPWELNSVN